MKRAFTILEATIGALMLSCLIAVFADYFVSRTTKARDSEMQTALYALTQSCNNALSNAYATAMQSRMQELVRNKGSISDFTLELPTGTMQDCYDVVRGAFRDYVYYNNGMSEVEDTFNRGYTGAKPIDGLAPILAIPEELYVNIQYIVQKPSASPVVPDFVATKSSHNPSYAWRFEYLGASHMSFTLYHTLVVTIFTDKDGLDFRAGMPALANYIKDGVINAANVVFTLHTQCEAEGFNMDGFEPMATSGTIASPFSTNLIARFADNPLVDDEQPEVPDVPDLRFARAGFDDLSLSVSFNQGSTPDTTPSGSITLKDLDLRQDITLKEGESIEWSISGSSAVIRGNGTSADIVFSGIDYARLAAGNHDFVETVTAKITKDGKVIRTITGKVRLGSSISKHSILNSELGVVRGGYIWSPSAPALMSCAHFLRLAISVPPGSYKVGWVDVSPIDYIEIKVWECPLYKQNSVNTSENCNYPHKPKILKLKCGSKGYIEPIGTKGNVITSIVATSKQQIWIWVDWEVVSTDWTGKFDFLSTGYVYSEPDFVYKDGIAYGGYKTFNVNAGGKSGYAPRDFKSYIAVYFDSRVLDCPCGKGSLSESLMIGLPYIQDFENPLWGCIEGASVYENSKNALLRNLQL